MQQHRVFFFVAINSIRLKATKATHRARMKNKMGSGWRLRERDNTMMRLRRNQSTIALWCAPGLARGPIRKKKEETSFPSSKRIYTFLHRSSRSRAGLPEYKLGTSHYRHLTMAQLTTNFIHGEMAFLIDGLSYLVYKAPEEEGNDGHSLGDKNLWPAPSLFPTKNNKAIKRFDKFEGKEITSGEKRKIGHIYNQSTS